MEHHFPSSHLPDSPLPLVALPHVQLFKPTKLLGSQHSGEAIAGWQCEVMLLQIRLFYWLNVKRCQLAFYLLTCNVDWFPAVICVSTAKTVVPPLSLALILARPVIPLPRHYSLWLPGIGSPLLGEPIFFSVKGAGEALVKFRTSCFEVVIHFS